MARPRGARIIVGEARTGKGDSDFGVRDGEVVELGAERDVVERAGAVDEDDVGGGAAVGIDITGVMPLPAEINRSLVAALSM